MMALVIGQEYNCKRADFGECRPGLRHPLAALLHLFEAFDEHAFDNAP
jgi:hypothetical protein